MPRGVHVRASATHLLCRTQRCAVLLASILALAAFGAQPVLAQGGDFAQPVTSPEKAGDHPGSVAVADFNRDTRPDLAVANRLSSDVTILLGDGTGNFTSAATGPERAGDGPTAVAVGDFNGDTRPDLAVANYSGFEDATEAVGFPVWDAANNLDAVDARQYLRQWTTALRGSGPKGEKPAPAAVCARTAGYAPPGLPRARVPAHASWLTITSMSPRSCRVVGSEP